VSPKLFVPTGYSKELPSVRAAIERGGIFYGVAGKSRDEVLAAVTRLPGIPKGVDRRLLHQLLVAREALAPTSVGDGIALPHPRDPVVVHVEQPAVFLCFLENSVEFGALDGRPVRVLFMLLSPTVRDHLQVLARLAAALHDARFKELLHAAAPRETILSQLRAVEGERSE
jgi:PTS system nitrogen regulatory IIA component